MVKQPRRVWVPFNGDDGEDAVGAIKALHAAAAEHGCYCGEITFEPFGRDDAVTRMMYPCPS